MKSNKLKREPKYIAKFKAFPYQQEAVDAVKDLEYAAIFHEQGLGKTKIAIDVLLYWLSECSMDTALIVTKKQLVANWVNEFKDHTSIKPAVLNTDKNNLNFERKVYDDFAIIIPAGKWHNLTNIGNVPIKLYSIYAQPNNP